MAKHKVFNCWLWLVLCTFLVQPALATDDATPVIPPDPGDWGTCTTDTYFSFTYRSNCPGAFSRSLNARDIPKSSWCAPDRELVQLETGRLGCAKDIVPPVQR